MNSIWQDIKGYVLAGVATVIAALVYLVGRKDKKIEELKSEIVVNKARRKVEKLDEKAEKVEKKFTDAIVNYEHLKHKHSSLIKRIRSHAKGEPSDSGANE